MPHVTPVHIHLTSQLRVEFRQMRMHACRVVVDAGNPIHAAPAQFGSSVMPSVYLSMAAAYFPFAKRALPSALSPSAALRLSGCAMRCARNEGPDGLGTPAAAAVPEAAAVWPRPSVAPAPAVCKLAARLPLPGSAAAPGACALSGLNVASSCADPQQPRKSSMQPAHGYSSPGPCRTAGKNVEREDDLRQKCTLKARYRQSKQAEIKFA